MGLRDYYQQDAGRWLEITCGVIILAFAGLSGFVAVLLLIRGLPDSGALVGVAIFGLVTWGLVVLALRLLRGYRRVGRVLLSPIALIVGAVIFLVGGVLFLYIAVTERDIRPLLGAVGNVPASYFSWKFALERRRKSLQRAE